MSELKNVKFFRVKHKHSGETLVRAENIEEAIQKWTIWAKSYYDFLSSSNPIDIEQVVLHLELNVVE